MQISNWIILNLTKLCTFYLLQCSVLEAKVVMGLQVRESSSEQVIGVRFCPEMLRAQWESFSILSVAWGITNCNQEYKDIASLYL